jgi:hypothetical protein
MSQEKLKILQAKIYDVEEQLKHLHEEHEEVIRNENVNLYNNKYYLFTIQPTNIFFEVKKAIKINSDDRLEFIGSKICKVENNLEKSIEYRFKTGEKLEFPITHVVEISKEKYYDVINDYLNYVQNEFKE